MPSGTFSTAEAAMDLGRELLAVPGSILSPESRGTNYLIANGACCIIDEESIEMAISRIYGTLRYSRPDAPGIADLDATQQTVPSSPRRSRLKTSPHSSPSMPSACSSSWARSSSRASSSA